LQSEHVNREITDWENKLPMTLNDVPPKAIAIKSLVQFLVATIAPAKIYMMQHDVAINNGSNRIIDLLLIMSGKCGVAFTELEPIINIACSQYQHISCSLHNEGSVLEWLRTGHIFYSLNCLPDNLVYDDKAVNYPVILARDLGHIKQKARQTFDWFFGKAQQFYSCAETLQKNSCSSLVMFMLHQAAELTFRAILISLNGYDKRTHEIRVLLKHSRRCAPALSTLFYESDQSKQIIQLLDNAYLDGRYSLEYNIDENILALIFEKVKLLHVTAFRIVQQALA
jgi:HEPN domain-containing protein